MAEKHFQAALEERKELVRLTPRPPEYNALVRSDLAQSQMLFGDYRLMGLKDAAAAMRDYEAGSRSTNGCWKTTRTIWSSSGPWRRVSIASVTWPTNKLAWRLFPERLSLLRFSFVVLGVPRIGQKACPD